MAAVAGRNPTETPNTPANVCFGRVQPEAWHRTQSATPTGRPETNRLDVPNGRFPRPLWGAGLSSAVTPVKRCDRPELGREADALGESRRLKAVGDDTLGDGSTRDGATRRSPTRREPHATDSGREGRGTEPAPLRGRVPCCGGSPGVYAGRGGHFTDFTGHTANVLTAGNLLCS